MSYEWDDKLTEKFLTLYRKHQCLWNPYSPNYKNCSAKNEAFRIVIQELNVPRIGISECLRQVGIIREKYKQEQLKEEKELKAGKLYTSKLPWFNLMSQMLCEVINDEENFSDVPVKITPCNVTRDKWNRDKYVESKFKQNNSNNYTKLEEEMEYRNSGLTKPTDGQSRYNNFQQESKAINDAKDLWNRCPSCGWETVKNQEKVNDGEIQFNYYKESPARYNPETEETLRIKPTKIFGTNSNDMNQLISPPPCVDEMSHFNCRINTPEGDTTQNRKKVQINSGIESSQNNYGGELYVSTQSKKWNLKEDEVPYRDDSAAKNSLNVVKAKENSAYYPRNIDELKKNVVMYPSHINDIYQSQFLENKLRNFEINQANNCKEDCRPNLLLYQDSFARQSQKISEFADAKPNATSEDDKYEMCSQFKIVIPSSDREDQNLEITGYEVRVMNPQSSRYMLCPSTEIPKAAAGSFECACKNEYSAPNKNADTDSARYGNIIKLDISHKRPKESRAKKRLRTSKTRCTRKETRRENDQDSEIGVQHKLLSNKGTQTDRYYGNESNQTSKDVETCNPSKYVKDQGCVFQNSAMNGKSCQATTLDENHSLAPQHQSTMIDDSVVSKKTTAPSQVENNSLPADEFNNTRIFLNVIVKILESEDTQNMSENLQTTLNTMLDRIEQMPMVGQRSMDHRADNNIEKFIFNDTTTSTQYKNLAPNPAPGKRETRNINSQKSTNEYVDLADSATDSRLDDTSLDSRPKSLSLKETSNVVNKEADESKRKSWPLTGTNKSINERSTRNEPPSSLLNNTNTSDHSVLDYTSEFLNEEPIASSSRRFTEHPTPSQLTKDLLDVIKYTMMMDGVLQPTENGNKDCCGRLNKSNDT